jgi:hypothetical protein
MDKEELLQQVRNLAAENLISKEELTRAYDEAFGKKIDLDITKKPGITKILYYIGGAIVFLGIAILIWQNWSTLSVATKIIATLGSGIAAYIVGVLFGRYEKLDPVGQAFYLISALVTPIGLYVVFDNAGFDIGSYGTQSLISGILFGTYLLSFVVFRKNIFTIFSIIFGTWLFFAFTSFLIGGKPHFDELNFFEYRALMTGLVYILLGYSFSKNEKHPLTGPLYGFGILGFLGAALALGGWEPNQNIFWELIYPGLVLGVIFLSVYLKSKVFLTFGSIYLMVYILKITAEYFTDSLGWPLALALVGLALIAIGYLSFYLNRKYLSSKNTKNI